MSKLSFQESMLSSDSSGESDAGNYSVRETNTRNTNDPVFAEVVLADVGIPENKRKKKNRKKRKRVGGAEAIDDGCEEGECIAAPETSPVTSHQTSISQESKAVPIIHGKSEHISVSLLTPWLRNFLQSKRVSGLVMPPEEFGITSSEYIQQFADNFKKAEQPSIDVDNDHENESVSSSSVDSDVDSDDNDDVDDDDDDDIIEMDEEGMMVLKPATALVRISTDTSRRSKTISEQEQVVVQDMDKVADPVEEVSVGSAFRLFNLPYNVSEREVRYCRYMHMLLYII